MIKKIHFYHIYCNSSHWRNIVNEHFNCIKKNNLIFDKIYVGIVGKEDNRKKVKHTLDKIISNFEIIEEQEEGYEQITLRNIKKMEEDLKDSFILYCHTKNARHTSKDIKFFERGEIWRRSMTFYVIEKWRDCLFVLLNKKSDSVGAFFIKKNNEKNFDHYGGNFFWIDGNSIYKLKEIEYETRYDAETWLGKSNFSFFDICDDEEKRKCFTFSLKLNKKYFFYKKIIKFFKKILAIHGLS